MIATYYKTDGSVEEIQHTDSIPLEKLQALVGGYIEVIDLPEDGKIMILNEEGKIEGLPKNNNATAIFKANYPIDQYPLNNDELIVGNVLVCENGALQ